MQANTKAGGSYPDLLSAIYKVEVRHEEKITTEDQIFCQQEQDKLYKTLAQIKQWYDLFVTEAEKYKDRYKFTYKANGSIGGDTYISSCNSDYTHCEFIPFEAINSLVKKYHQAVRAFGSRIIEHFNQTYDISASDPEIDADTLSMGFLPVYSTYVDKVIEHLGGRSFRDTAEDEIIRRFHHVVKPSVWSNAKAELNGCKISFPDIINFDPFYYENYKQHHIHYNSTKPLEPFCAGIAFGAADMLNGSSSIIRQFHANDVDISRWYELTIPNAEQMRFFKNGRIDVKFKDALAAERCYSRLLLHKIEMPKDE